VAHIPSRVLLKQKLGQVLRQRRSHGTHERRGHPRHRTNPRAHIVPSPASVTRPGSRTHVCSYGYAGTINLSCRHKKHPTCLITLRLQTCGAGRVQYLDRYVTIANDARGPCIYERVRHCFQTQKQVCDHLARQCQSLLKYLSILAFVNKLLCPVTSHTLAVHIHILTHQGHRPATLQVSPLLAIIV
jgi:hypothetical protein